MSDLKNIKDILQNYEVEYDPQDWIRLEKDLPKPGISGLTKTILVASTIIVTIASIILINNLFDKEPQVENKTTEQISNNNNNTNQTIISENNNSSNTDNTDNTTVNIDNNNNITHQDNSDNTTNNNITNSNNQNSENTEINTNDTQDVNSINNITEEDIEADVIPDISKAKFYYEISDKCTPVSIKFIAENVPDGCKILWNTGDNAKVYGNTAEYIYTEDGKFYPEVNITFNNFILKNEDLEIVELYKPTPTKINFDNSENLYYFTTDNEEELEYLWTIDSQEFREREASYTFNKTSEYTINLSIVNQFGCKTEVNKNVNVVIEHVFYLPNAFTPNSNGVNSEFGPIGEDMNFTSYQLLIVDGHGNLVFSSNNFEDRWNGKVNNIGENAKPGYYLWEIKTMDEYGNIQTKKGRVNLIWN